MRFPERERDLFLLQNAQTGFGVHSAHCSLLPVPLSPGYSDWVVKLAVLIYRCGRNEWSIPPPPPLVSSWHAQGQLIGLKDCSLKTSNVMSGGERYKGWL